MAPYGRGHSRNGNSPRDRRPRHREGVVPCRTHHSDSSRSPLSRKAASDIQPTRAAFSSARNSRWRHARSRDRKSEEHTSELQSLMRLPYAVFCLTKTNNTIHGNKAHKTHIQVEI